MNSEYTDLGDDWADIRAKFTHIDHELVNEMISLLADIPIWVARGDNDEVRAIAAEMEERLKVCDGPRSAVLALVHMAATQVPFEIDDPEDEDEPFAFRAWRTVEHGFPVMDKRAALDPTLRVFPRRTYTVERTETEVLVSPDGVMEEPKKV